MYSFKCDSSREENVILNLQVILSSRKTEYIMVTSTFYQVTEQCELETASQ